MTDFAVTVFELANERARLAPSFKAQYIEEDTGSEWFIDCAASRAYFTRINHKGLDPDFQEQGADSHFMVRRLVASLLMGGGGLFQYCTLARFVLQHVWGNVVWHNDMGSATVNAPDRVPEVDSWFAAISTNTFLRRSAEDAVAALLNPYDSIFYVYRGLEWLQEGLNVGTAELASWMRVPKSEINKLGRMASPRLVFATPLPAESAFEPALTQSRGSVA